MTGSKCVGRRSTVGCRREELYGDSPIKGLGEIDAMSDALAYLANARHQPSGEHLQSQPPSND